MRFIRSSLSIACLASVVGGAALLPACSSAATADDPTSATTTNVAEVSPTGDVHSALYEFGGHTYRRVCEDTAPDQPRCTSFVATDENGMIRSSPISPYAISGYQQNDWGAADIASAYNLPTFLNPNATVAIVIPYDDPTAESDLAVYRSFYGLPACTTANGCFKKVGQTGSTTALPIIDTTGRAEFETSIDLDMASAACPTCKLLLVEGTLTPITHAGALGTGSMMPAVDEAVALGATVVSMSWGYNEALPDGGTNSNTSNDSHFNHPAVSFFASSGDNGLGVEWPAASPYVTGVGGTVLTATTS